MNRKLIVPLLFFVIGHLYIDFTVGVWSIFKTLAGLDLAKAGLIAGISIFLGDIFQLLFGFFGDRGYRKGLVIVGILLATCVSLFAYTDNYILLMLLMLMCMMGSGAFHPSACGAIQGLSTAQRGIFLTIFVAGGKTGSALSHSLYASVFTVFEGRTWIILLIGLFIALFFYFYPFPKDQSENNRMNLKEQLFALAPYRKKIFFLYFLQVITQALSICLIFYLPDILTIKSYPTWFCYGGGNLFFMLGAAILAIPGGYLSDRIGARQVIIFSLASSMICFYFFLMLPISSTIIATICLFVLGGVTGVTLPLIVSIGVRMVPANCSGIISGTLLGAASCVAGLFLFLTGCISKCFVLDAPLKAMEIMGIVYLLAIPLVLSVDEKQSASQVITLT